MYLCICRALNERAVVSAADAGACSVSDIFRHHQTEPKCGRCAQDIRAYVRDRRRDQAASCQEIENITYSQSQPEAVFA